MPQKKGKYTLGKFTLRVGKSRTGRGVFAMDAIPKGAFVIEYLGRKVGKREQKLDKGKYLFWTSDTDVIDGNIPGNTARFINHSCAPNCEAAGPDGRVFIMALRAIKAGEELTYDYGDEYFDQHLRPKGCLCNKCSPC